MKIEVIPYQPEHLLKFAPRNASDDFAPWVAAQAADQNGAMGTLVADPHVLGFVGYHVRNEATAEVWIMLSRDLFGGSISIVRAVRFFMSQCFEAGFRRLQALADVDNQVAWRFLEALGFEREGILRSYGPKGEDRFMYGRVECRRL